MSKLELGNKKNDYSNSKNIRRLYNDFLQKTVDNSNQKDKNKEKEKERKKTTGSTAAMYASVANKAS